MNVSGAVLVDQADAARERWPFLDQIEADYVLPTGLLLAVGSRETNLDPRYTEGSVGDGGHGHGLFQLDDRSHDIPDGFDIDARAQATWAAKMLVDLRDRHGSWQAALNAYNSGSPLTSRTTGGDYGPDVLERRDYLAARVSVTGAGTVEAVLGWLRANLGLGETPAGSNCNWITQQFFVDAGRPLELAPGCFAWCAAVVSLALNHAWGDEHRWAVPGVKATYAVGTAWVPGLRQAFVDAGRYHADPEVGDVAIFAWSPGAPIGDHTAIVEQLPGDGTVVTIDGNPNGNVLSRQRRSLTLCDGFGRPPYLLAPPPLDISEDDMRLIGVTNNRGIFLISGSLQASGKAKGKALARYIETTEDATALVESHVVPEYNQKPDLPEAVFNRLFSVVP